MTHIHSKRSSLLGLAALIGVAAWLWFSLQYGPSVQAHARVDRALPEPDSTLVESLAEVRVWFTQELTLRGNELWVADADGNQVDNGDAAVDQGDPNRKQLAVSLPTLSSGTYTVRWTSSSAEDGHSLSDSYQFTVALAGAEPVGEGAATPPEAEESVVEDETAGAAARAAGQRVCPAKG